VESIAPRDDLIAALHWRTTKPQRKVTDTLRRFLNGGLIVRKHNGFELTDKGKGTIAAGDEKAIDALANLKRITPQVISVQLDQVDSI
jgi:hypothetical protein